VCSPVYQKGQVFVCGVKYREEDMMILEEEDVEVDMPSRFKMIQENIRVLEDQEVALINVPVPEFDDSDPADIVHDFQRVRKLNRLQSCCLLLTPAMFLWG
jgi:integral membrane protein 2B